MYGVPYYHYNNQDYNQDNNQDYNHAYNQDWDYDNEEYGNDNNSFTGSRNFGRSKYHRYEHYGNAYGNYRGGYGPGMMYMSPQEMGTPSGSYNSSQSNNFIKPLMAQDHKSMSGWIRGYGPSGPLKKKVQAEERFMRQLIRCGIPKENVEKLPKEILHKLDIDYCGLCSQSFDSTATAKLHYLSKSHLKTQKKWVMKRLDSVKLTSQTPLKDRELYCELCDIHITSKQHADSHYSGKAHRAIVEGRKDPKNGALLRRDMEERYEQLIEREKKFLDTVVVKPEAPKVKEPKEGPPELCCHICKTVVTCSEQMTMHLNGKKHLSKEKQYILNTMRGVVQEKGDKATYTQETYRQDGKEDTGNEEDNGDNDNENFPEEQ